MLGDSTGGGDIADALNGAGGVGVATADRWRGGPKGGGAGRRPALATSAPAAAAT